MKGGILGVLGSDCCLPFLALEDLKSFLTGGETAVLGQRDEAGLDVWPCLLPAVVTEQVAQGKHGIDVTTLPVHYVCCSLNHLHL